MTDLVRVTDFDAAQDEWQALLSSSSVNTIFVTPQWQRTWWRNFGRGSELYILLARDADKVVGIAPLMLSHGILSFLGDTDLVDYHDFPVLAGHEETFHVALWEHLIGLDWHTLDLRSLKQNSPALEHIPRLAEKMDISIEVVEEDISPIVRLPGTWDEYLARLHKKARHELRRKLRRLERTGDYQQYLCDDAQDLPHWMNEFFRLLRASGMDKDAFLTQPREKFFLDLSIELMPRGQFKLYFLQVNGISIASCICFDYANSYLLYNSGYDPNYSNLSAGLLNKALCIRDAIEAGRSYFDFLRGAERYKYDLGANDQNLYHLIARR